MGYDDANENKKSVFNAGIAQTERIDALQRAINAARFNPLMKNFDTGTFNYEVMISSNEALLYEAWAKLNKDEKDRAERVRLTIIGFMKHHSPLIPNREGGLVLNTENYEKLLELLNLYEKMNKELLDAHNLNAPTAEEEGYF